MHVERIINAFKQAGRQADGRAKILLMELNQASHSMLQFRSNVLDNVQHQNFLIRLVVAINLYLLLSCRRWKYMFSLLLCVSVFFSRVVSCFLLCHSSQSTTAHINAV